MLLKALAFVAIYLIAYLIAAVAMTVKIEKWVNTENDEMDPEDAYEEGMRMRDEFAKFRFCGIEQGTPMFKVIGILLWPAMLTKCWITWNKVTKESKL